MKLKQSLKNYFVLLNLVLFLSSQTFALSETTKMGVQGVLWSVQVIEAANQMESAIDRQFNDLLRDDEVEARENENNKNVFSVQGFAQSDRNSRREKIEKRWITKLTKRYPKLIRQYEQSVDAMSADEARKESIALSQKLRASGNEELAAQIEAKVFSSTDLKKTLKESFKNQAPNRIATIAHTIADAGGAIPFILQLKKQVQELREKARMASKNPQSMGEASRSVASLDDNQALLLIMLTLMVIVGIVIMVGSNVLFGGILIFLAVCPGLILVITST